MDLNQDNKNGQNDEIMKSKLEQKDKSGVYGVK